MAKFKEFLDKEKLNEYPHLATANGAIDIFAEKGDWIDRFIQYANDLKNDKRFLDSVNKQLFTLFWKKKVADVMNNQKLKDILNKLPQNIKTILKDL